MCVRSSNSTAQDNDVCPIPGCNANGQSPYLHHHFHTDHNEYEWMFALTRFFDDPDIRSEYVDSSDIPSTESLFSDEKYDAKIKSALEHHPIFSEEMAEAMFGSLSKAISSPAKKYVHHQYEPDRHEYELVRYKHQNEERIKNIHHPKYGPKWGRLKWQVLNRDDFVCRICGTSIVAEGELDVHHITPAHNFDSRTEMNNLSNLVTVCKSCHGNHEGKHQDATADEWAELVRNNLEMTDTNN